MQLTESENQLQRKIIDVTENHWGVGCSAIVTAVYALKAAGRDDLIKRGVEQMKMLLDELKSEIDEAEKTDRWEFPDIIGESDE